jgi:hypothetical protein
MKGKTNMNTSTIIDHSGLYQSKMILPPMILPSIASGEIAAGLISKDFKAFQTYSPRLSGSPRLRLFPTVPAHHAAEGYGRLQKVIERSFLRLHLHACAPTHGPHLTASE